MHLVLFNDDQLIMLGFCPCIVALGTQKQSDVELKLPIVFIGNFLPINMTFSIA